MKQNNCVTGDTRIYVDGTLKMASELFKQLADVKSKEEVSTGGGGYMFDTKKVTYTNSIDDKTGKIVEGKIIKLYRKAIETDILLVTLMNGLKITVTKEHKLYTRYGWQDSTKYKVGSYIGVPRKLLPCRKIAKVDGKKVTKELAELLSWQISEGYEAKNNNSVTITQKDTSVLVDLQISATKVAKYYNINLNGHAIKHRFIK